MKKIYCCFFFFLFATATLWAQTTAIPDTAFEQELIALGIDSDGVVNGQMSTSDAVGVTYLDVSGTSSSPNNIQDLTGIADFVDLDTLDCQYNQLTALNLSSNTALTILRCYNNNLTSLSISNSTSLVFLQCYNNNLPTLNINNNTALRHLSCYNNPLGNLDVTKHPNLLYLDCTDNQLSTLNLYNNTQLQTLFCGVNNLTTLDVSQQGALIYLDCRSNKLTDLDITNNPQLSTLDCSSNDFTSLNINDKSNLIWFSAANNQLSRLSLLGSGGIQQMNCTTNPAYLYICVDDASAAYSNSLWQKPPAANYTENCYPRSVIGRVSIDTNNNCLTDSTETGLRGSVLAFARGSTVFYETTIDTLGRFIAHLDTGRYEVTITPPSPYWDVCLDTQQVFIDSNYTIVTLNASLQPKVSCPMLEVDISAPLLRMTGNGSYYTVGYCNNGTADVTNAQVEVELDEYLNVLGTNTPIVSQVGNKYTFNVGDLAIGECGRFDIQVLVDTAAIFEQTHCATAKISPDSICIQGLWSGPVLEASVTCFDDTLYFTIENTGAAMLAPQAFSIFEDQIMMRTGGVILGGGQDTVIIQAAVPKSTYRINVAQASGYPPLLGDSVVTAAVEGCNPLADGSFNTGFITQFSNGNSSPFEAIDCQENVGSYDPNDKSAQPRGYDDTHHYIYQNTIIDYKIRFQNTGTDTAFNIVILDTISADLDISTIRMGAASYPYTWEIRNGNVLQVTFSNIMLPDSNVNEPRSHGFFRFRIAQQPNNPLGTVINNAVSIYFDFNPPIKTNTTWHTVSDNFVEVNVAVDKVYTKETNVLVYPNPFEQATTIEVQGMEVSELTLLVYAVDGKLVRTISTKHKKRLTLRRQNLPQGVYFYRLEGEGKQWISTGKIIVK